MQPPGGARHAYCAQGAFLIQFEPSVSIKFSCFAAILASIGNAAAPVGARSGPLAPSVFWGWGSKLSVMENPAYCLPIPCTAVSAASTERGAGSYAPHRPREAAVVFGPLPRRHPPTPLRNAMSSPRTCPTPSSISLILN